MDRRRGLRRRRHRRARHHRPGRPGRAARPQTPPPTPGGSIDLSWAAATDNVGVTGYKLYRGTAAGVYGAPTALGNVTTYTDATAVTGTRYYYAVSRRRRRRQRGRQVARVLRHRRRQQHRPARRLRRHLRVRHRRRGLTPAWTLSGTPQRAEYDTARAKNGALSGWIQGPTTAAAAGASVPAVMTSNGAEYRFWMYADTANENRYVSDTGSVFELRTDTTGKLLVYTKRTATGYTANAYTAVGTYAVGWTEYRVVLDFTADTYTLSKRATASRRLDAAEVRHAPPPTPSPCVRPPTAPPRPTCSSAATPTPTCGSTTCASRTPASSTRPTPDTTPPTAPATLSAVDRPADTGRLDRPVLGRGHRQRRRHRLQALPRHGRRAPTAHRPRSVTSPPTPTPPPSPAPATTTRSPPSTPPATRAPSRRGLRDRRRQPRTRPSPDRPCRRRRRPAQVALTWTANTESDLAGYDVYRDGVKVNADPDHRHDLHRHRTRRRHHLLLPPRRRRRPRQRERASARAVSRRPRSARRPSPPPSTAPSSPVPTARPDPGLDALGHPPARRVRHRPRQERHPVRLDPGPDAPPPSPAPRFPPS